jgi:tmRNA-binding protein
MKPQKKNQLHKSICKNEGEKNTLMRRIQIFIWRVKLNCKIALIKGKQIKRMRIKLKKNNKKTKNLIE